MFKYFLFLISSLSVFGGVVGVYPMIVKPKSDGYIGLPLEEPSLLYGKIESVNNNKIKLNILDIKLNSECFLKVLTGQLKGYEFHVISANGNEIVLEQASENLNLLIGENISIIPYWTIERIMRHSEPYNGMQIFIREAEIGGINRVPNITLTYVNGIWYDREFKNLNSYAIKHYTGLTIRNTSSESFVLELVGNVSQTQRVFKLILPMSYEGNDRFFTLGFPVGAKLKEIKDIPDMVSIMTYETEGFNPSPNNIYTHFRGNWYDSKFKYANEFELRPDKTYVIRFLPPHQEFTWTFKPFYLQNK